MYSRGDLLNSQQLGCQERREVRVTMSPATACPQRFNALTLDPTSQRSHPLSIAVWKPNLKHTDLVDIEDAAEAPAHQMQPEPASGSECIVLIHRPCAFLGLNIFFPCACSIAHRFFRKHFSQITLLSSKHCHRAPCFLCYPRRLPGPSPKL